jgi:hypothetical protein
MKHKHDWVLDHLSCCYVLKCTKCSKVTGAYHHKGRIPQIGEHVRLDESTDTIEVINK